MSFELKSSHLVVLSESELGNGLASYITQLRHTTEVKARNKMISTLVSGVKAMAKTKDRPVPARHVLYSINMQHCVADQDTLFIFTFIEEGKKHDSFSIPSVGNT